jgi:hypothetical protein
LGGGVAITWAFVLPMMAALLYSWTKIAHIEEASPQYAVTNGVILQTNWRRCF